MGALFVVKYGSRVTPHADALAFVYAVSFLAALALGPPRLRLSASVVRWSATLIVAAALGLALFAPEANRVARLPALAVWLDRLAAGTFPYASPIRPSGFPGLYALASPFWATSTLHLLPVVGLVVFAATALRTARGPVLSLLGLGLLPSMWYEVAVHSELFFNAALALASLWAFERVRKRGGVALAGAAALAGVFLSTRLVVGVAYAVWGAYAFRDAWGRGLAFAAIALAVWTATWVPFALWENAQFADVGPFAIQGLYLPRSVLVAGAAAALALGWLATSLPDVVARTGWLLFGLVAVSFGITAAELGFETAIYDGFDLAYFVLPTPFLLLTLGWGGRIVEPHSSPES